MVAAVEVPVTSTDHFQRQETDRIRIRIRTVVPFLSNLCLFGNSGFCIAFFWQWHSAHVRSNVKCELRRKDAIDSNHFMQGY